MTGSARPDPSAAGFDLLPSPRDAHAMTRQVGVEVEFMGIDAQAAAQALATELGGTVVEKDPHLFLLQGTCLGNLRVELDIRYAHPEEHGQALPIHLAPRMAAWLGSALSHVVPRELITAPLPPEALTDVDRTIEVLRRGGAIGRGTTWFGSLGLHFNVDPGHLRVETLVTILQAFLLLDPWLRCQTMAKAPRRWSSFLPKPYPAGYVRRVVAPDYQPDLSAFVADYLSANPTRDRDLDLLPIFLHLDEAQVRARLPYEKIGSRPVLHYRLPQARVGEPGWSIAPDWNRWVVVERLAGNPVRLEALARAYLGFEGTVEAWVQLVASSVARR